MIFAAANHTPSSLIRRGSGRGRGLLPRLRFELPIAALLALALAFPVRAGDFKVHGLLDLALTGRGPGFDVNQLTEGDSPLDPWGLRVFAEGNINPRVAVFTQAVLHDPAVPYIEAAYVVLSPSTERDLHLMAGKIPWPIGTYEPRSYSDKNPLIGKPLMYQYHTTLLWYALPSSADALIAAGGSGQSSVGYTGLGGTGMPVIDDGYWDTGAVINGSLRPIEFAVGATNGTPGWGNTGEDENHGKTVLGRVGLAPLPAFRAGVSGAYGPYLVEGLDSRLPPGKTANDYHQRLAMADAELLAGYAELRAEGYVNVWENPSLGDLRVHGGYVEGQWTLVPGVVLAGRGEMMRFSTLRDSGGLDQPWDHDRDRIEAGVCYRPDRDVRIKGVWQRNREMSAAGDRQFDLVALGLSVSF